MSRMKNGASTCGRGALALLALLSGHTLFGCSSESGAESDAQVIKLGFFSRNDSDFSDEANVSLVLMALRDMNDAGGLTLGGQKYTLDLEVARFPDPSVEAAESAFQELMDAGVKGVLGPPWSSQLLGNIQEQDGIWRNAVSSEMVVISQSATSSMISGLDDENYIFRVMPSDLNQARVAAQEAFDRGFRQVSIVRRGDSYAEGLANEFVQLFEELGGSVLTDQAYDVSGEVADVLDYSFDQELDAALEGEPELLYVLAFEEMVQIGQRLLERGDLTENPGLQLFASDSVYDPYILEVCPPEFLSRLSGTSPGVDETSSDYEKFSEALEDEGLGEPWNASSQLYDAVHLMVYAMQAADSPEPSVYKDFIAPVSRQDEGDTIVYGADTDRAFESLEKGQGINFEGVSGPLELDAAGDPTAGYYLVWHVDVPEGGVAEFVTDKIVPFEP